MKVHEALARAFVEEGVEHVFSLMGDGNMYWQAALAATGKVAIYDVRHEGAGVAMADGYARASGRPGVCAVTSGPGLTNTATALMAAFRHGTPLVMFAGDTPAAGKRMGGLQDLDQQPFVEASGGYFQPLRGARFALEDVQRAFYIARTERRPVVLNAPMDIQNEELPGPFAYVPSTQLIPPPVTLHPDPQRIEQAAAMLAKVERPIIIAGEGAHDARAELVALADRIGALIATTVRAKGWFDDNPYAIDIAGGFSSKVAETLFARADAVVAVGASLGDYTTAGATLFPRARVLQIDQAPFRLVDGRRLADCYVQGDARHALTALNSRLERIGHQRSGLRTAETDQLLAVDPRIAEMNEIRLNLEENCVDPRALMLELDRLLPDDCVIVIGAAHFWSFPARFLSGKRARRFFCTYDFGTIAQGVPTAVGVSIALGHRPIAVVEGDASFLMNVQDIDTAVRHRVPLLIVIMNDGALGAEYHKLNARALDVAGSVVPTPDLAEVTRAFGGGGALVTHIDELEAAARLPAPGSTPFLIDARVSRSVASRLYRRRDYRLPE